MAFGLSKDSSFSAWLENMCTGECKACGLYQPHRKISCRGSEKMMIKSYIAENPLLAIYDEETIINKILKEES